MLLPLGILLLLLGLLLPRPLSKAAGDMEVGLLRSAALVSADFFRLCAFTGIGCALIGVLRNRKHIRQTTPPTS